jgi:hypothetical protein
MIIHSLAAFAIALTDLICLLEERYDGEPQALGKTSINVGSDTLQLDPAALLPGGAASSLHRDRHLITGNAIEASCHVHRGSRCGT